MLGDERGHPHGERLVEHFAVEAAVLGQTLLGDVHFRAQLDEAVEPVEGRGEREHGPQHPVDAKEHVAAVAGRRQVDVGGALAHREVEDVFEQTLGAVDPVHVLLQQPELTLDDRLRRVLGEVVVLPDCLGDPRELALQATHPPAGAAADHLGHGIGRAVAEHHRQGVVVEA